MDNKKYQVYGHKACNDGQAAMVALYHKLPKGSKFTPVSYGTDIKCDKDITNVIFVDFTPSKEIVSELILSGKEVFILDHHKTAVDIILDYGELLKAHNLRYFIYQNACGAQLAHWFNIDDLNTTNSSVLVHTDTLLTNVELNYDYVGDLENPLDYFYYLVDVRDRWIMTDPRVKEIADNLTFYLTANSWFWLPVEDAAKFIEGLDHDMLGDMISSGEAMTVFNNFISKEAISKSFKTVIPVNVDKSVHMALVPTTINVSNAGNMFVSRYPEEPALFIGVYHDFKKQSFNLSLRSNEHFNSRLLAERLKSDGVAFTGGGHDQAAGANIFIYENVETIDGLIATLVNTIIAMEG